jgi:hypothetical protein
MLRLLHLAFDTLELVNDQLRELTSKTNEKRMVRERFVYLDLLKANGDSAMDGEWSQLERTGSTLTSERDFHCDTLRLYHSQKVLG